jgi:DNA-binding CsgD family transcriptional regulator/pSer/pThr/pTyr-binding forkhead associated (FHA) protein
MAVWLEYQGTKHVIVDEVFLGRHKENHICLVTEGVSRRHALVYPQSGAYFISDLGSTNGVLINGVRIKQPTALDDKDEVLLGKALLVFRWPGHRVAQQALPSSGVSQRTAVVASSLGAGNRIVLRVNENLQIRDEDSGWKMLLKRFFREPADPYTAMPPRMHAWLRATTAALARENSQADPFVAENEGSRLVLRCIKASAAEWFLLCTVETPLFAAAMLQLLGLSDREANVMQWLADGKTNGEIAEILSIATGTVNKHVESILKKLGVENRAQAIREVIDRVGRG